MRKLPDIFFCLLIGISFLTAKTGLTVHHCLREGSSHVVLLSADPSCRAVHAQQAGHTPEADCTRDNSASHGSCERIHDQDCCSTEVYFLEDPSLVSDGLDTPAPECTRITAYLAIQAIPDMASILEQAAETAARLLQPLPGENSVYTGNHLVAMRL